MRDLYVFIIALFSFVATLSAQQDAMFTKYMFNQLSYNPAYAGSNEFMSVNLVYRNQWWGIEKAPVSQTLTAHTPLSGNKVGVGLSIINDKIGPDVGTTSANFSYAYHIPIGSGKLSVALQGGIMNYRADFTKLTIKENNDIAFADMTPNRWLPNFGSGLYYYAENFYVGVSVPRILNHGLRDRAGTVRRAMQARHYYFMAGGMIPINPTLKLKPMLLIKNVGLYGEFQNHTAVSYTSAPTEFDLDVSLLFYDMLWFGVSFRSAFEAVTDRSSMDSGNFWAAYYLRSGLRLGISYDYTLSKIQSRAKGSFDVMLGYDFSFEEKKIVTPRYF